MAPRNTLSYKQLLNSSISRRRRHVSACTLVVNFAFAACARDGLLEGRDQYQLAVVSGDRQAARAGMPLGAPLVVRVTTRESGAAQPGIRVRFSVPDGGVGRATVNDGIAVTDADGIASARITPLRARDTVVVEARLATAPWVAAALTVFSGEALTITAVRPASVRAGDTVLVEVAGAIGADARVRFGSQLAAAIPTNGGVRAVVPACLPAGAVAVALEVDGAATNALSLLVTGSRAALALGPFEFTTIPASLLGSCISLAGRGNTYLVSAQFASVPPDPEAVFAWRLGADGGTATAAFVAAAAGDPAALRRSGPRSLRDAFDASLRKMESSVADARGSSSMAGMGAEATRGSRAAAQGGSSAGVQPPPPVVGSLREFSVVAATDGSRFRRVVARVRYAGDRIVAYADTTDNAFASDQLVALVRLMDRDLYPAAVRTFGAVPDVDGDGRLMVLFSPVVNALARAEDCVFRGYVKGFFYPPDQLERATGSNRAEIFHAFVPDPAGKYSCPHTEEEVVRALQPEFLHEMQHLISFNERVLVRGGQREETWLGEGLSHVAEELGARVFEARYPPPSGRTNAMQIFPDSAGPFISPLLLNAYIFLNTTLQHSLTAYVGAGSLEEHGASWLFARWLAAQRGDDVLRRLVQGGRTGIANLEAATGEPFTRLFGDFSLALFADSLPGIARAAVPARLRFGDRNVRQLMGREAAIAGFAQPFPITTFLLRPGGALRSSMRAGTMIYAILQTDPATNAVGLSFTTPTLSALASALGAQVGVLRLPP